MLEGVILAFAQLQEPVTRKREDNIMVVGTAVSASTVPFTTRISDELFTATAATYQSRPPLLDEDDFISPVKRSFMVTAPVVIGGRIAQPPIDEEEIVYFDEWD